ncbi:MAG: hypothetical protein ACKO7B_15795 [Flavobacteriales bacterium]
MKLQIHHDDTLEKVQRSFNSEFPYLKLEFFSRPHDKGKPSEKQYMINSRRTLETCNPSILNKTLSIPTAMTVHELEHTFRQELGLYVQVFRKSGRVWLETTATDTWSLHKQNLEGQELSSAKTEASEDFPDYHELP